MKREREIYLLFGGTHSRGGMDDLIGAYATVKKAKKAFAAHFGANVPERWNNDDMPDRHGSIFNLKTFRTECSCWRADAFGEWTDWDLCSDGMQAREDLMIAPTRKQLLALRDKELAELRLRDKEVIERRQGGQWHATFMEAADE